MNFIEFPIHQSLIRKVLRNGEEREFCLRRLYITSIAKTMREPSSDPMLFGRYFESQVLGSSAGGEKVNDLPRKKLTKKALQENAVRKAEGKKPLKGEKYTHHLRIDEQIQRFKALQHKYKVMVNKLNVQVPLMTLWDQDPDVMLACELDIFPTTVLLDDKLEAAVIDLKITADIHNTFGEFCYGAPEYLDLIQAKMYHYIVRNATEKVNPILSELLTPSIRKLIDDNRFLFLLWIFNYKKAELDDKFIKVKWDKTKADELNESIRKTIAILEDGEAQDWPTNPDYAHCKKCPWTQCPDRIKVQTV
jgi:hypothetical protein